MVTRKKKDPDVWFTGSAWTHRLAADILMYGPISRTSLARLHHLSQGTVSRITSDLIFKHIIAPTDAPARTEGLPASIAGTTGESEHRRGHGGPDSDDEEATAEADTAGTAKQETRATVGGTTGAASPSGNGHRTAQGTTETVHSHNPNSPSTLEESANPAKPGNSTGPGSAPHGSAPQGPSSQGAATGANSPSAQGAPDEEEGSGVGRGRPQTNLDIIRTTHSFIGVNLRGSLASALLVDIGSEPKGPMHEARITETDPLDVVVTLTRLIKDCAKDARKAGLPSPRMVGISIGGHVLRKGTVDYAPFLGWNHPIPFAHMLSDATGLHCYVSNNLLALMRYEQWFGAGKGMTDFAVVTVGVGVGYGLVSGGRVVTCPGYSYGLAGHIPLDPDGPRCFEGRRHRGCSQSLTDNSIADEYSHRLGRDATFADYTRDVKEGKPQARQLMADESFRMGVLLGTIANLAMPREIFIAGESCAPLRYGSDSIRAGIKEYRPSAAPSVPFRILDDSDVPWVRGAATQVIRRFMLGSTAELSSGTME